MTAGPANECTEALWREKVCDVGAEPAECLADDVGYVRLEAVALSRLDASGGELVVELPGDWVVLVRDEDLYIEP